jgi:hypothetical protein
VARIDAAGAVDTSTSLGTTAFLGDNVRSAVTSDGSAFWIGGNSSAGGSSRGVFYTTLGAATSTLIESASKSTRVCQIVFGQLYCTSNSAPYMNVFAVGNGLPAVATPTLRSLTSDASASPFGFVLLDLAGGDGVPDTLYVADDRAPPSGGIQKWSLSGATWTQVGTINSGLQVGVRGLTGYAGGGGAVLIATTATASPVSNAIVRYSDASGTTPTMTTLQAASSGVTVFRGVALAPR